MNKRWYTVKNIKSKTLTTGIFFALHYQSMYDPRDDMLEKMKFSFKSNVCK